MARKGGLIVASIAKFTVAIECANAAFDENTAGETARILRQLADRIEREHAGRFPDDYPLSDLNGNRIGKALFYIGRNGK